MNSAETREVPISDANGDELRTFALTHLGMSFDPTVGDEEVRAKVREAHNREVISVPVKSEDDSVQAQSKGRPPTPATDQQKPPGEKEVRLLIPVQDEPGGNEPVPVGVNGQVFLIPRGEEVDVPLKYYLVLKNAIAWHYDSLPDGRGINPIPREIPAYPFQVISTPS